MSRATVQLKRNSGTDLQMHFFGFLVDQATWAILFICLGQTHLAQQKSKQNKWANPKNDPIKSQNPILKPN